MRTSWRVTTTVKVLAVLAVTLAAAALTGRAWLRPLTSPNSVPGAAPVPRDGCEPDPSALSELATEIEAAVAASHLARQSGQVWRLHSICRQGDWAYAFVNGYHRDTLAPLPAPSEVLLAQRTAEGWQVMLPDMAAAYNQALRALPEALVPGSARTLLEQPVAAAATTRGVAGFALPYPAGQSAYVTWHWYYALDFTIGMANGSNGIIRNAKAGTAVFVKDSSTRECGNPPPDWYCWMAANLIVIQSAPDEFAWYLHLAPHSIPDWIQEGTHVPAGADIGHEGVTGWAALPHLHFQVSSSFACCDGEGDSRMPFWSYYNLYPVNFSEYAWGNLPTSATSQNGAAPPPGAPEPTAAPPPNDPPPAQPPAEPAPTQPPAPPPAAAACPSPYVVQRGDWLLKIAERCRTTLAAIVAANPGLTPNRIYAGQALNLPGGAAAPPADPAPAVTQPPPPPAPTPAQPAGRCSGTHTVAAGENLFRIAFNCGLTTAQMAAVNGIGPPYTIHVGQVLRYP